jgi:hypothetical protein
MKSHPRCKSTVGIGFRVPVEDVTPDRMRSSARINDEDFLNQSVNNDLNETMIRGNLFNSLLGSPQHEQASVIYQYHQDKEECN